MPSHDETVLLRVPIKTSAKNNKQPRNGKQQGLVKDIGDILFIERQRGALM